MSERIDLIADILMGAAHADHHLDGRELDAVRELLRKASGGPLTAKVSMRLDSFDPSTFDLGATVAALGLEDEGEKRHLVELVSTVHDSDDVWDLDEDAYLRELATALGLELEAIADLTVEELVIEDLGAILLPPPLPKA
ncbi:MAG: TerB family tellurite resistance protein [Polyangiaceae bacterium]